MAQHVVTCKDSMNNVTPGFSSMETFLQNAMNTYDRLVNFENYRSYSLHPDERYPPKRT